MNGEVVTLTIDGKAVTVPAGTLIIRAAEALGVEIPRFCEHPKLTPVGACRQCIVEVEGQKKPVTSCTTPVADGMVVRTQHTSDIAAKSQRGMLEFLLINHPLDCPVCDRGGECPLQDQALAWGPGESRYIDPKRVYRKPMPLSPLVLLDRERCVLCTRCTRFCDEISGERFIELFDRGAAEQVSIAPGEDFRSPFSGNTVQICPVGALTSTTYRFAARPFDIRHGDSVCPHCASGCTLRVDIRRGEVVRHLGRDNDDVNDGWLCDKGRYAFRFPDRERLTTPMMRVPGLEPVSFQEVFREISDRAQSGGGRVAFIAGGRLTDEDAYALSKLARRVFGTNDLDHRSFEAADALEAEAYAASGMPATYRDVEAAKAIVVVGLDPREELPILHLRIRKAARHSGAGVIVVGPRRTALADIAEHVLSRPGEEAAALRGLTTDERVAATLREAGDGLVVLAGPRLAGSADALRAARSLASEHGGRFTYLSRRAGDRGALKAGVHPALLPGGRRVDDERMRADVEVAWGELPGERGRSTREILEAASKREIDVLFLVGVDPLTDFPDPVFVEQALANVPFLVVQDITLRGYEEYADAALPAAAFLEKDGHFTDWEGRGQRIRTVRPAPGLARADWQIFQELSEVMGKDMGFRSLDHLWREMGELLGGTSGRDAARGSPEGVVAQRAGGERASPEGEPSGETASGENTLTLFTYPLLVDEGRLSVNADELKAALEDEPFVEVHPRDAERLGLANGGVAVVRNEMGEARLPVRVSDGIAPGAAFVPWNQPGFRANELFERGLLTRATVEAAEPAEEGAA